MKTHRILIAKPHHTIMQCQSRLKNFTLALLFLPCAVPAQAVSIDWITNVIDSPVLISLADGGTGSGFYLSTSNHIFLVTAKHVLFDLTTGRMRATNATLTSYSTGSNGSVRCELRLNLGQLAADGEIRAHPTHDTTVVRFGASHESEISTVRRHVIVVTNPSPGVLRTSAGTLRRKKDVRIGDDIYVFSYPTSLNPASLGLPLPVAFDPERPLLRKGIVAGKDDKAERIIIDSSVFFGNSGGPVVELQSHETGAYFNIIGVVSQFIPFTDMSESKRLHTITVAQYNSGYAVVEPADFILDLLW